MKELIEKINAAAEAFKADAEKALNGNKAAGVRARKATLEIAKLGAEFRKTSLK